MTIRRSDGPEEPLRKGPEAAVETTPTESVRGAAARRAARVRWQDGAWRQEDDLLAAESPLEIRIGSAATVLLRTPGDDDELVAGFLWSEGIVTHPGDLVAVTRLPADPDADAVIGGDIVAVTLAPAMRDPARRELVPLGERQPRQPAERLFYASSSCGACGKTSLAALAVEAPAIVSGLAVEAAVVGSLPERMRAAQRTFAATGGLHGAALFTAAGELVAVREDVGRHNAVDKLVGWALRAGRLPLGDLVLQVSGRLGYEIVQKAIVAGVPIVAAVGAASTLAVDLAVRHRVTVATFVRPGSMNVAGPAWRVVGARPSSAGPHPLG